MANIGVISPEPGGDRILIDGIIPIAFSPLKQDPTLQRITKTVVVKGCQVEPDDGTAGKLFSQIWFSQYGG